MKIVQRRQGNNIKDLWIVRFDSPLQSMRWLTLPYQRLFFQEYGYSKDAEFPGDAKQLWIILFQLSCEISRQLFWKKSPYGRHQALFVDLLEGSKMATRRQKKTTLDLGLGWHFGDWDDKFWLSKLKAEFSICKYDHEGFSEIHLIENHCGCGLYMSIHIILYQNSKTRGVSMNCPFLQPFSSENTCTSEVGWWLLRKVPLCCRSPWRDPWTVLMERWNLGGRPRRGTVAQ